MSDPGVHYVHQLRNSDRNRLSVPIPLLLAVMQVIQELSGANRISPFRWVREQ
jgi:hypothetical protein